MCDFNQVGDLQIQKHQAPIHVQVQQQEQQNLQQNQQAQQLDEQQWMALDYKQKYARDAKLKLPPDFQSPELSKHSKFMKRKEQKILQGKQVSPYEPTLEDIRMPSEKRRDAITHMHQSAVENFLQKKNLPKGMERLLKDMRYYLKDANDAVRLRDEGDVNPGLWAKFKGLFSAGRWFKNQKKRNQIVSIKKRIKELAGKLSNQEKEEFASVTKFLSDYDERTSQGNLKDIPQNEVVDTTANQFLATKEEEGEVVDLEIKLKDRRNEPLFPQEPSLRDIAQGGLGDCYFLAALASAVSKDPEYIRDMMQDDGQGNVTVRFYRQETEGDKTIYNKPVYIKVSKQLPQDFARHSLWTQVMEKAYTVFRTLYGNEGDENNQLTADQKFDYRTAESGNSNIAFEHIYGEKSTSWSADETTKGTHKEINRLSTFLSKIATQKDGKEEEMKNYAAVKRRVNKYWNENLKPMKQKAWLDLLRKYGSAKVQKRAQLEEEFYKIEQELDALDPDDEALEALRDKKNDEMNKKMRELIPIQDATKDEVEAIEQKPEYILEVERLNQMKESYRKQISLPQGLGLAVSEYEIVLTDEKTLKDVLELAKKKGVAGDDETIRNSASTYMNKAITYCAQNLKMEWVNDIEVYTEDKTKKKNKKDPKANLKFQGMQTEKLATIEDHVKTLQAVKADIEANGIRDYLDEFFKEVKFEEADKAAIIDLLKQGTLNLIDRYIQDADKQTILHHAPMSGNYTDAAKKIYEEIETAVERGPVAAGTMQNAEGKDASGLNNEAVHEGLADTHAYTVLGVKEINGKKFIKCRNPWAKGNVNMKEEVNEKGEKDYTFDMTYDLESGIGFVELNHFLQRFNNIYYSGSSKLVNTAP